MPTTPRNVADAAMPDRCTFREASPEGYYACDQAILHSVHDERRRARDPLVHRFRNDDWEQCKYVEHRGGSTWHCVRTEDHRGAHQFAEDPDESPERLSTAIDELQRRMSPEGRALLMAELSSIAAVYKRALEAIFEYSRPEIIQPPNWHRTIYDIAEAALSDPPRVIDLGEEATPDDVARVSADHLRMKRDNFVKAFRDVDSVGAPVRFAFPSEAELSSAMAQVFSREADDGRNTGIRPFAENELRAWNYVIDHFEAFAASPRTAKAVIEELRKNRG